MFAAKIIIFENEKLKAMIVFVFIIQFPLIESIIHFFYQNIILLQLITQRAYFSSYIELLIAYLPAYEQWPGRRRFPAFLTFRYMYLCKYTYLTSISRMNQLKMIKTV